MSGFSIEFNSFIICARCPRTGALGICTATGEMAVTSCACGSGSHGSVS